MIAAAIANPFDVMAVFEIGHDPLHSAFGDPDSFGNLAEPDFGVLGDEQQNVCMIAQESPGRLRRRDDLADRTLAFIGAFWPAHSVFSQPTPGT